MWNKITGWDILIAKILDDSIDVDFIIRELRKLSIEKYLSSEEKLKEEQLRLRRFIRRYRKNK
jgi:hypothetical protein